jgi:phospholipid transport system substrate-binding protein
MHTRRNLIAAAAVLAASAGLGGGVAWSAENEAEAFVREKASQALKSLNDPKADVALRGARFQALMEQMADIDAVSRFVLGRYAARFDAKSYAEYKQAFREYALAVYQAQLDQYRGDAVKMLGSVERKPGDVVVKTAISSKKRGEDLPVNWRVKKTAVGWRVIDVQAFGLWLAIEQRADFENVLDQGGGKPAILIGRIRQMTADLRSGKSIDNNG